MLDRVVRTIGSWGIGRALISTWESGPMALLNSVQAAWLSDIQVMYWSRFGQVDSLYKLGERETHGVVCARLILETIHGKISTAQFVRGLIRGCKGGHGLLVRATTVRIIYSEAWIINDGVVRLWIRIVEVEWLTI